jgi:hypothetical protein
MTSGRRFYLKKMGMNVAWWNRKLISNTNFLVGNKKKVNNLRNWVRDGRIILRKNSQPVLLQSLGHLFHRLITIFLKGDSLNYRNFTIKFSRPGPLSSPTACSHQLWALVFCQKSQFQHWSALASLITPLYHWHKEDTNKEELP